MKRIAIAGLLVALMLAGCATTPPIDGNARVGAYTYDQAVKDYGPPMSQATLNDGSKVADWMTERGSTVTTSAPGPYVYGPGYYSMRGSYGPGWRNTTAPAAPIPARNLRRFPYNSLGVISDERMSSVCLISIDEPPPI